MKLKWKKINKENIQDDRTFGSFLGANGIPVTTTALPAWSAKSNPSLTYKIKAV